MRKRNRVSFMILSCLLSLFLLPATNSYAAAIEIKVSPYVETVAKSMDVISGPQHTFTASYSGDSVTVNYNNQTSPDCGSVERYLWWSATGSSTRNYAYYDAYNSSIYSRVGSFTLTDCESVRPWIGIKVYSSFSETFYNFNDFTIKMYPTEIGVVTSDYGGCLYLYKVNSRGSLYGGTVYRGSSSTKGVYIPQSDLEIGQEYCLYYMSSGSSYYNYHITTFTVEEADTTPPTLALSQTPTAWTNSTVSINIAASDNKALQSITVNGIVLPPTTTSYPIASNGTYQVIATDASGNSTTQQIGVSNIDKANPTVGITLT